MCHSAHREIVNERRNRCLWLTLAIAVALVLHSTAPCTLAADCNGNAIDDLVDISTGASPDCGANGIPDECEPDGVCVSACDLVVLDENFSGYVSSGDPDNWFDTEINSATVENDTLFRDVMLGGQAVFSTDLPHVNIHSHYVGPNSADLSNMTYTGRMRLTHDNGGIGVTFLSQFSDQPTSTHEYLRLRRANYSTEARTFHLAPANFDNLVGDTDSGVDPAIDTWYRFRIDVDTTGAEMRIQANVWEDGQPEPAGYQIDAVDPSGQHPTSGTVGVWSMADGIKYWDDLHVVSRNALVTCDDLDACTVGDVCSNGVCQGEQVDCSHLDSVCTVGACNAMSGVCEALPANEGGGCDDSNNCTNGDACTAGECLGTPVDCSPLDDACLVGTCNPQDGLCDAVPTNEGGACDDLIACTANDSCMDGVCSGEFVDCSHLNDICVVGLCNSSNGLCEAVPTNEDGACDDTDLCTTADACSNGVCVGVAVDCSTLDTDCIVGICSQSSGECESVAANEGGVCSDLDHCTTGDVCIDGVCSGTPLDCSHLDIGCLEGECDPVTGDCELPLESTDCDTNGQPDVCEFLTFPNYQKFVASDGAAGDSFGVVAVDGDTAVIGAPGDNDDRGAAFVFRLIDGTWQQIRKLTADDLSTNDDFGTSVAISGGTIVVGVPAGDGAVENSGVAYVFSEGGGDWQQVAKLEGNDANESDYFGISVAIDGNTAIVGANNDRDLVPVGGSAYVFREVGGLWQEIAKLTPDDGVPAEFFGTSVAIDGDTAVIGAQFGGPDIRTRTGSVYVFREIGGTWQHMTELLADDGAAYDGFGFSVGIDGDLVVMGSPYSGIGGAAYLFEEAASNWQQIRKLTPPDLNSSEQFGLNVAIERSLLAVGAPGDNENGENSGAAYVSRRSGVDWLPLQKLTAADGASNDKLGTTITIASGFLLAGAPGDGNSRGSVYAFEVLDYDCNTNGVLDECDIESGVEADCDLNGVPDVCEPFGENSQDCSCLDDQCVIGVCSLENATCSTIPANEGGLCDDLDACSPVDVCAAGTCIGMRTDCSSNALPPECPTMLYVDDSATNGLNDGSSWANAYVHLQDALAQAEQYCGINEIWVAAGTYRPDQGGGHNPGDRDATFQLFSGLEVYGGFNGTESTLEERDIESNGTILSGDLLGNDVFIACEDTSPDCDAVGGSCRLGRCLFGTPFADNAISVVNGSGTDSTATIDGFVISNGSAHGQGVVDSGGGMTIVDGSPLISNCQFSDNMSGERGGAIRNDSASPTIIDCKFINNYADYEAGAIYNGDGSAPLIVDSRFSGNAYSAVVNEFSSPTIVGCTFEGGNLDDARRVDSTFSDVFIDDCIFQNSVGGAIEAGGCDLIVSNSEFIGNSAYLGGGAIFLGNSYSILPNCRFEDNDVFGGGGAIAVSSGSTLIEKCVMLNNESEYVGGALAARFDSNLNVYSCRFINNTAAEDGGAIWSDYYGKIANSNFVGNHAGFFGGAISSSFGSLTVVNCTLYANSAVYYGGAWSGTMSLRNSIVWGNTPNQFGGTSSSSAHYSIVQGGAAGLSAIRVYDENPLFVDSNGPDGIAGTEDDNLRLLPGSLAIDSADLFHLPDEIVDDLDGHDRIVDDPRTPYTPGPFAHVGILDIGAYEFVLGDCDADGDADIDDHFILDGCLTSPDQPLGVGCACLDLDSDGDVDLRDFGFFQMAFIP
ncbi:MAG: hypothetical protein DHS20C16_11550 [Phycisphaerae bacterium]|nr:MAG: hypothetical protein DHS20C16_11550 [Phycisphaerae bacterium]